MSNDPEISILNHAPAAISSYWNPAWATLHHPVFYRIAYIIYRFNEVNAIVVTPITFHGMNRTEGLVSFGGLLSLRTKLLPL